MYHLVVEEIRREMSELIQDDNDYNEVFREDIKSEFVEFSVGNPRVEHITGIVHLYKQNSVPYGSAATSQATKQSSSSTSPATQAQNGDEVDVSNTVCCLAVPADMSVAHFCSFIGAYLQEVRAIQVLRREGVQRSVCMVLLTFPDKDKADSFYNDFNGLPFSSLEPDILCRLVFVRSVEVISARGRPILTAAAVATQQKATAAVKSTSPFRNNSSSNPATSNRKQPVPGLSKSSTGSEQTTHSVEVPDREITPANDELTSAANKKTARDQQAANTSSSPRSAEQPAAETAAAGDAPSQQQQSYAAAAAAGTPAAAAQVTAQAAAPTSDLAVTASPVNEVAVAAAVAPCLLWLEPPPGTTELPTCPVCLERLDEHISGIVTTVCNHRFHGECLKRWGDTSCPVCRYCMYSSDTSTSKCSTCGTNANLWICLICGHVGCGRYKQGHASDHWQESSHCYALELETQRVWDYAGDGYVHRLIQSKTDGKLVEVPSPAPHTCTHGNQGQHHRHHRHHRSGQGSSRLDRAQSGCSGATGSCSTAPPGDIDIAEDEECPICMREHQQLKDALVTSKLDAITLEYNYLLTTQLDSQRLYFEGLLAQQEARYQQQVAAAKAAAEQEAAAHEAVAASAREVERKRQQLERKLLELSSSVAKVGEEREFLRSLNETLLANQKDFSSKLQSAQAALADKDAELKDLQEQVRDLMVYIEAQRTIESSGGELHDATLLPVPDRPKATNRQQRRNKR